MHKETIRHLKIFIKFLLFYCKYYRMCYIYNMKTISELTRVELDKNPLIAVLLTSDMLNIRAVAKFFRSNIETQLGQKVNLESISMALRRYSTKSSKDVVGAFLKPQNIQINGSYHNLSALNYIRGHTGAETVADSVRYFVQTTGTNEHTIIISSEDEKLLSKKSQLRKITKLSALCLGLPINSSEIHAVYATILLDIAASGITIVELVSTFNEITIFVKSEDFQPLFKIFDKV